MCSSLAGSRPVNWIGEGKADVGADTAKDQMDDMGGTCDALVELSRSLGAALTIGDLDLVNRLLNERGRVLSRLDSNDLSSGTGPRSTMKSQLLSRIREVLRIDEETELVLKARLRETRDRIDTMGIGRQVVRQYSCVATKSEPTYIDRRQ